MKQNCEKAEEMIDQIMREYDACGLAACIIDHTGKTLYETFRGYRNKETGQLVNGDTIFGLASVTKSFTALSLLQMAQKGMLSLSDPVSLYIPDFTNCNTEAVTIAHLLSHAGGFFPQKRIVIDEIAEELGIHETEDSDLAYHELLAETGCRLVAQRLDQLTEENGLIGRPGEFFSYCNDGYGLLSEIIRRKGGQNSYAEYLNDNILKPLNMNRSFCDFYRPAHDDNAAVLYEKKDGVMKGHRDYHDNAFVLNGGGAMKSTLNDMKKYLCMYLNHGKGIVSADMIDEMIQKRQPYGTDGSYGYGLYTEPIGKYQITGHGGSLPGVSSHIAFSFDSDCAVIVLCNTSGVPVSAVSNILFRMYVGLPLKEEKIYTIQPMSEEIKTEISGLYASDEGTEFEIYQDEAHHLILKEEEDQKQIHETGPFTGLIHNRYTDIAVRAVIRKNKIIAVQYGSRIIPRR